MAETLVENQICGSCGAEVRAGALFCYNCGSAVGAEIAVQKIDKKETFDENQLAKTVSKDGENGFEPEIKQVETKQKEPVKELLEKLPEEPDVQKDTKLKSAATMRGKSKLVKLQKVEVVWEEREAAPNFWFILVALFLAILAAVILFLAIRLK